MVNFEYFSFGFLFPTASFMPETGLKIGQKIKKKDTNSLKMGSRRQANDDYLTKTRFFPGKSKENWVL